MKKLNLNRTLILFNEKVENVNFELGTMQVLWKEKIFSGVHSYQKRDEKNRIKEVILFFTYF